MPSPLNPPTNDPGPLTQQEIDALREDAKRASREMQAHFASEEPQDRADDES